MEALGSSSWIRAEAGSIRVTGGKQSSWRAKGSHSGAYCYAEECALYLGVREVVLLFEIEI